MLVSASLAANSAGCFLPEQEKLLGIGDERETIGPLWDTAKVEPTRRNARPAAEKMTVSPSQRRRRRRSNALEAAVTDAQRRPGFQKLIGKTETLTN